ncbi:MAG: SMI1/KNR4 family protein [Agrococcus casei]|uniref:SMI1/KNR4 family protein n=1 Tax=Agrococcus casei TaxID=343512 RepID=UPI003F90435A
MNIDSAWDIIDRVLADQLPQVAETLRGPVDDADLARLAQSVGRELPEDFVTSLRRHDGQDNPTALLDLFDHHTLLSATAMIDHSKMRIEALGDDIDDTIDWMTPDKVRPIMNCRGWLQFTTAETDGYALDLDPLPAGEAGQILYLPIDGPTPAPEFPSYRAWLSNYAEKLDAGAFTIDDALGLWLT